MIDVVAMKGRWFIILAQLQPKALEHLHTNHVNIEKTRLLAWRSLGWFNINEDIQWNIKLYSTCMEFQIDVTQKQDHTSWNCMQTMGK